MIEVAAPQRTLRRDQENDLRRLLRDIRRGIERHAKPLYTTRTAITPPQEGIQQ